jgi:hypothetical protein
MLADMTSRAHFQRGGSMQRAGTKMHHIVYMSRATKHFPPGELNDLCHQSAEHNRENSITGLLIYDGHRYMQLIEGHKESVEALMSRISLDTRHSHITYLTDASVANRSFTGWALTCIGFQQNTTSAKLLADVKYKVRHMGNKDLMAAFIGFAALAK